MRVFWEGEEGYDLEYEGGDYWVFTGWVGIPGEDGRQNAASDTLTILDGKEERSLELSLTQQYDSHYRLDLKEGKLTPGRGPVFSLVHYGLRLGVTLLVEGVLFFLFGFRHRRSYVVFLAVNAITQLAFGLVLANFSLPVGSGAYGRFFLVIGMELLIMLVEGAIYAWLLKEQTVKRRVCFAVFANLASWLLGSYLMYRVFHLQAYVL